MFQKKKKKNEIHEKSAALIVETKFPGNRFCSRSAKKLVYGENMIVLGLFGPHPVFRG